MSLDLLWLLAALAIWGLVGHAARDWEFHGLFQEKLYGLCPSHLKEDAYSRWISSILPYRRVVKHRDSYTTWTVILVAAPSVLLVFSSAGQKVAKAILPPALFFFLEQAAQASRWESLFSYSLLFGIALHAFPLIAVARRASRGPSTPSTAPPRDAATRTLIALFAFQQFLLTRFMSRLLSIRRIPTPQTQGDRLHGSTSEIVMATLARAISQAPAPVAARVAAEYARCNEQFGPPPGTGAAATHNDALADVHAHKKVMRLFECYGIPETRTLVGWLTNRHGGRRFLTVQAQGQIDGIDFDPAWIDNVGACANRRRRWNSFLLRVHDKDGSIRAAASPDSVVKISNLAQKKLLRPICCRVARVAEGEQKETLFLGSVVEESDVPQFNRRVKAVLN